MTLIFTPIATDNFTPNANPLNPAHWETFTDATIYGSARANGGKFESTNSTFNNGLAGGALYIAAVPPPDQYITVTLAAWTVGIGGEVDLYLRADATGDNNYALYIEDDDDPAMGGSISLIGAIDGGNTTYDFLDLDGLAIAQGDVWTLAIVGYTLYIYQNGVLLNPGGTVDPYQLIASGNVGADVVPANTASDTTFSNFIMGSVTTNQIGGPITPFTVGVGSYQGSSLTTAFPNVQGLDIFQVINEGGQVVWNLNAVGVATNNPTKPTPGTLLGQYEGSNFQAAFPNPYQLNIFQVISQGGSVVFYVDYQGNAAI